MDLELAGRTAIVTGASKGIGLATVQALVHEGARVVAGARHASDEIRALVDAGSVQFVEADLGTADGCEALVRAAGHGVDILVNNVGTATTRLGGFLEITDEQWLTSVNLNLMAAVRMTRAVLPGMLEAGSGVIVNTSSVNAFLPDPLVMDYSATKAAVTNFAKALSKEVGPRGIRICSVCPGPVETDLWLGAGGVAQTVAQSGGATPEQVASAAVAGTATGRFTHPDEVAAAIVWLASARAANITGATLTIDGGLISTI
jgi:NAD(P)-dependent dehydrogenase (short-subunit alcohol dehydrogenase family)